MKIFLIPYNTIQRVNVSNGSDFITWTPIADCMGNNITQYSGTFDGNNKTVSGLYFNGNSIRIGLFGSSEADGNIKNVGVVDSYFKGNDFVGGVCGRNDGTITNCYYYHSKPRVNDETYSGELYKDGDKSTVIFKTQKEMGTGEVTWLLNESGKNDIWRQREIGSADISLNKATAGSSKILMGRIPLLPLIYIDWITARRQNSRRFALWMKSQEILQTQNTTV